jgi:hypothetical protein
MTINKDSWERITIKPVCNNQYALKSAFNGERYVKVKVAFKSAGWGSYLQAHQGNDAKVFTQTYIWSWEEYYLEVYK